MLMGFLNGEVFANEELLIRPTRIITGFLTGHPVDRILTLMPEKGNMERLFIFFAFTIGVGVLINSVGLIINIINQITLKNYEKAFFAKTGLAGALLFWYALFMAVRLALGQPFAWFDIVGLAVPVFFHILGPRVVSARDGTKTRHGTWGTGVFMEGFVVILEPSLTYDVEHGKFPAGGGRLPLSHTVVVLHCVYPVIDGCRTGRL